MPATPARIGLVTSEFRVATTSNQTAADRYGSDARDTPPDEPAETFFESAADAQAMATERMGLMGAERRRFTCTVTDPDVPFNLTLSGRTPAAQVIDPERAADLSCAIVEVGVDFKLGRAVLTTWG